MPAAREILSRPFSPAEEHAAALALGGDHAMVRVLARRRSLAFQLVVTSVPISFGLVGIERRASAAPYVLGAAAGVALGITAALLVVRLAVRGHARELLAGGRRDLRLRAVVAERRRLVRPRVRKRLARSLERYLRDAETWDEILPPYRPPAGVRCLRFAGGEVDDVASRLRSDGARAEGAAAVDRFLTDGVSSPLFVGDVDVLRRELVRIAELLAPAAASVDVAPSERIAA